MFFNFYHFTESSDKNICSINLFEDNLTCTNSNEFSISNDTGFFVCYLVFPKVS